MKHIWQIAGRLTGTLLAGTLMMLLVWLCLWLWHGFITWLT